MVIRAINPKFDCFVNCNNQLDMRYLRSLLSLLTVLFIHTTYSQTQDSPWIFSLGANAISLVGTEVESGLNFGGPAFSLSRHVAGGLSIGTQYSLGQVDNFSDSYTYTSLDGYLKMNLVKSGFTPYLIAGYGFSLFSDGVQREGFFPSSETSRTYFGGVGFNVFSSGKIAINVQSSYRMMNENDGFDHLQHLLGIGYSFGAGDTDKDGVSDKKDKCPNVPGLKEFDGCPDSDGDGIIDKEDKCPEIAGTIEFQGCIDTDGDGIADPDDTCPDEPGSIEMNGCPDSDGDGLSDAIDQCIEEVGPAENKGCPWPDDDQDGVPNKDDLCPDEKGTTANNGCPELSTEIVQTLNDFGSRIYFPANSAQIIGKKTREVLEEIKDVLFENPKGKIIIEGYASSDGDEDYNIDLSMRRAEAVMEYLIGLGISPVRLELEGYGESDPVGDNSEPKGRAINRRVQFKPKRD